MGLALPTRQPIPLWSIDREAGESLLATLPLNVPVHLGFDENQPEVGTRDGRVRIHPTVSHFGQNNSPRLLMDTRSFGGGSFGFLDLSPDLLHDLGWPTSDARLAQFGGTWFNPARSGEGCLLTLEGDDQTFILTCYFNDNGGQAWFIGATTLDGDVLDFNPITITSGAAYGGEFDPADVVRQSFGRARVSLSDCNNATIDIWSELAEFPNFQTGMGKIIPANCRLNSASQSDRRLAGSYFALGRSGEGAQVSIEADGSAIVAWYSYDQGRQLWVFGNGRGSAELIQIADAVITQGANYGAAFDPSDVRTVVFGDIELRWLDCNRLLMRIEPELEGFEASERDLVRIVERQC